jgi:hypothetical protein
MYSVPIHCTVCLYTVHAAVVIDYWYGVVTVLKQLRKIAKASSFMSIFEARP